MKCVLCCVIFSSLMTSVLALDGSGYLNICGTYLRFGGADLTDVPDYGDAGEYNMCFGYHRGVIEAHETWEMSIKVKTICLPDGVTDDQMIRVTIKHLKENPAKLHMYAAVHIMAALQEAFPCKKEN